MSGLSLKVGGFGGVGTTASPAYGTDQSYNSVTSAAFGPGVTVPVSGPASALHPATPAGLAVWVGAGALALLILVRMSLPR